MNLYIYPPDQADAFDESPYWRRVISDLCAQVLSSRIGCFPCDSLTPPKIQANSQSDEPTKLE
jgi:hypothetical protein